jgi:hypothetical protein
MERLLPAAKEAGFPDPKAPSALSEVHHHFERNA